MRIVAVSATAASASISEKPATASGFAQSSRRRLLAQTDRVDLDRGAGGGPNQQSDALRRPDALRRWRRPCRRALASMRHLRAASEPVSRPNGSALRSGRPAMIIRAASTSARCRSALRVARRLELASAAIAARPAAMTPSAASASISVNPALASSGTADRHNLNSSGQPIDPNLIAEALAADRDHASAGRAAREEIDRRSRPDGPRSAAQAEPKT